MTTRRSPLQILVLAGAVACGVVIGAWAIGWRTARPGSEHGRGAMPDIQLEDATPAQLARLGYRLSGKEPRSWSAISLRAFQDERGTVTLVRCHIDADEVAMLFRFPPGSRRPQSDAPPRDWPWGVPGDPFAVPAWWRPQGGQSRIYEQFAGPTAAGLFANYDAATGILHFWQWLRSDWKVERQSPLQHLVADELAMALNDACHSRGPVGADGWLHATALPPAACGLPPGRLPASVTSIDVALLPLPHRHRYLLAVHGLDAGQAADLTGEQPLRALAPDGPPPLARWGFAALPGSPAALPAWFTPGPGTRAGHCLLVLGSGRVEAGRWVAYDAHAATLYVWDWEGPEAQPAQADLCR
jgi:hypothetical protein